MTSESTYEGADSQQGRTDEPTRRQAVRRRVNEYRQSMTWKHAAAAIGAAAVTAGGVIWAWRRYGG